MRVLYFAWVREGVGTAEEQVTPPPHVATAGELLTWLAIDRPVLADHARLRVAVDQAMADWDTDIRSVSEVAIFPPVTGG